MNRDQRRAFASTTKFWRVTPLFRSPEKPDEELDARRGDFTNAHAKELKALKLKLVPDLSGSSLEEHVETSLIDGAFDECVIIRVPPSCSMAMARDIEQRLTTELKRNCIVVTRNIEFCAVDVVDKSEMAHLLKGIDNPGPIEEERRAMAPPAKSEVVTVTDGGVKVIDKRGVRE